MDHIGRDWHQREAQRDASLAIRDAAFYDVLDRA